ncbi:YncE family protein [Veronia pacifica]|nr:hypothetical protein [Veronia pacifica]
MIKPWQPTFAPVAMYPGKKPEGNCLSPDGATLFVTNRLDDQVVAVDTQTLELTGRADTGRDPTRAYISPKDQIFVTNYGGKSITLFSQALENLGEIALPADPIAVSFHPDGKSAFVSMTNDQVAIMDVDSLTISRTFDCLAEPDVSFLLPSFSFK